MAPSVLHAPPTPLPSGVSRMPEPATPTTPMPTRLPAGLEESVNFQRRRARIQEMEHQQATEDLADMKLTKVRGTRTVLRAWFAHASTTLQSQLKTLNGTFSTVEVQYTDLDGLTWTDPRARLILEDWKNLNTVSAPAPIMAPLMTRENRKCTMLPPPPRPTSALVRPPPEASRMSPVAMSRTSTTLGTIRGPERTNGQVPSVLSHISNIALLETVGPRYTTIGSPPAMSRRSTMVLPHTRLIPSKLEAQSERQSSQMSPSHNNHASSQQASLTTGDASLYPAMTPPTHAAPPATVSSHGPFISYLVSAISAASLSADADSDLMQSNSESGELPPHVQSLPRIATDTTVTTDAQGTVKPDTVNVPHPVYYVHGSPGSPNRFNRERERTRPRGRRNSYNTLSLTQDARSLRMRKASPVTIRLVSASAEVYTVA
ncbi:hypothetical protein PHLCEN_2v10242 [Hermanssonia centrifuga]|uniref:Uncharacterized protein n=1 Tax=Hermanssonia centrifuga TaxID=98765 RepID=A0A2R6NNF0_9APHY|nr:hypothetical protein PHLCEN_2v10242 [Hermanssonia centrifuga]